MNIPKNADQLSSGSEDSGKGFMEFNEGEVYTGIGRTIEELIMKTNSFIVFLDEFGGVQWGYSAVAVGEDDYSVVSNRVAELETRSRFLRDPNPCPPGTKIAEHQAQLFGARRLLAEGISRLLDSGSRDAAQGVLDTGEKWILQRSLACSRQWLLKPFVTLALGGLGVFFALLLNWGTLPESGSPWLWLLGALLGGAGALVSNVVFNRTIPFDATAGKSLHEMEAVLRWSVGASAGLVVQLLIQGDLFLGFLAGEGSNAASALALSFFAGLSELFFPTLLRQFDQAGAREPGGKQGQAAGSGE